MYVPEYIIKMYNLFDSMYERGIITAYTYQILTSNLENYY